MEARMSRIRYSTRARFLKQSVAAATAFALGGRALVFAKDALASECVYITCVPEGYMCEPPTLYLQMTCNDAFSGYYCYADWIVVGCCYG
jgi:hypothetical protein